MAKSSSFFGLRTGSTKSLTFQVMRGQQITKDRVTRVSNPRTTAQMEQRAKLPIVAAARSALKDLVDHSWEGITYGYPSLQKFSSKNLSAGALNVISYATPDAPSPGIAEYNVSQGTLNGFDYRQNKNSIAFLKGMLLAPDEKVFPKLDKGTKASTVLYHMMKYFENNNINILEPGEQLTFLNLVFLYGKEINIVGGSDSGTYSVPVTGFDISRLIIPDPTAIKDIESYTDANDSFTLQNAIAEGGGNVATLVDKKGRIIKIDCSASFEISSSIDGYMVVGAALIDSKLVNNVWKRSTENIHVISEIPGGTFPFVDWAKLYAPKKARSDKYLNNGSASTEVGSL